MTIRLMLFVGLTVSVVVMLSLAACRSASPPYPTSTMDQKKVPNQGRIRVVETLGSLENCGMTHGVRPVYPKEPKRAHIQGVVKLNIVITKTGEVGELRVLSGDPVLVPAAIAAVKQWRYAPCRVDGSEPIAIKTQVDVPFALNQ
jgi:TonB family protein